MMYSVYAIGFLANSKLSQILPAVWLQVPQRVFILFMPQDLAWTPIFSCHFGSNSFDTILSSFRYQSINTCSRFMRALFGRTCKQILFLLFTLMCEGLSS